MSSVREYPAVLICVVLIVFSPAVSGSPSSMIRSANFAWFPLSNPGLVSIPASFLLGVIGTLLGSRERVDPARHAETEVRSLTGAGAVRATTEGPGGSGPVIAGPVPVGGPPLPRRESDAGRGRPAPQLCDADPAEGMTAPQPPVDDQGYLLLPPQRAVPGPGVNEVTLPHFSLHPDGRRRS